MNIVKYTKNIDHFIVNTLPFVEVYITEHHEPLKIYTHEYICALLKIMYGPKINAIIAKQLHALGNIVDLETYLGETYNLTLHVPYVRPIRLNIQPYLNTKKYVCIHPKWKMGDLYHNMSNAQLDMLIQKNKLQSYERYIIGDEFDILNTRQTRDISNFTEAITYIQACALFITSESYWHYIAILCNCRNIIVYATNDKHLPFNPYNANIHITNDLGSNDVSQFINTHLKSTDKTLG
jgi:ADP-heptose:LPS heptosyltransferase